VVVSHREHNLHPYCWNPISAVQARGCGRLLCMVTLMAAQVLCPDVHWHWEDWDHSDSRGGYAWGGGQVRQGVPGQGMQPGSTGDRQTKHAQKQCAGPNAHDDLGLPRCAAWGFGCNHQPCVQQRSLVPQSSRATKVWLMTTLAWCHRWACVHLRGGLPGLPRALEGAQGVYHRQHWPITCAPRARRMYCRCPSCCAPPSAPCTSARTKSLQSWGSARTTRCG